VTGISMMVGLMAAAAFSWGGYAAGIIGALLFQLSAIIDCCDGEIARLTFTESPFGEMFDLLADNVVHAAIFAAIAASVFFHQGDGSSGMMPVMLGGAALLGNACSLWVVLWAKKLRKTKGWYTPAQAARSNFVLQHIASRDFSIVVLIFALLNHLDWFLWLAAFGINAFWMITALMTRPLFRPRG
jgi:phosphatidylglycerophosphate synthase